MNDLDTLRPEVREAVLYYDQPLDDPDPHWDIIRAELLRLTRERDHARQMHADRDEELQDALGRAENAEAELAAALKANRDCVDHFEQMQDELAALKARIAEAPVAYLTSKTGVGPCNVASMAHGVVFDSSSYGKSVRVVLDE